MKIPTQLIYKLLWIQRNIKMIIYPIFTKNIVTKCNFKKLGIWYLVFGFWALFGFGIWIFQKPSFLETLFGYNPLPWPTYFIEFRYLNLWCLTHMKGLSVSTTHILLPTSLDKFSQLFQVGKFILGGIRTRAFRARFQHSTIELWTFDY